ncbi:MAG: hypothetical protein O3B17_05820 [Actinomycetota bacterium]|nr:hypothetical protein [Actinomycetota bacterium]
MSEKKFNENTKLKKLVILYAYRFRDFDWQRYELEFLSDYLEVHVHELIDALTPEFSVSYANQSELPNVLRFSSIRSWHKEFNKVSENSIIFSYIPSTSFKLLVLNLLMKLSRSKVVAFRTGGVPFSSLRLDPNKRDLPQSIKDTLHFVWRNLLRFIKPDFVVVGGSEELLRVKRDFPKSVKVVLANSSDFSNRIRLSEINQDIKKISIYLDTGFPGFPRDEVLEKTIEYIPAEDWYPKLNLFFEKVEAFLNTKVNISIHPKHIGRDHQPLFGERATIGGQTAELVSQCELVIATNSTAISYAVAFLKPLFLITSDQIENGFDQYKRSLIKNISSETGATIFNIDREYSEQEIRAALVIDHEKYESYKQKYLTSRTDGKPNYHVLLEEVINSQI